MNLTQAKNEMGKPSWKPITNNNGSQLADAYNGRRISE